MSQTRLVATTTALAGVVLSGCSTMSAAPPQLVLSQHQIEPVMRTGGGEWTAEQHYRAGRATRALGIPDVARYHFKEALLKDPTMVDAINAMAAILMAEGRYEDSLALVKQAIAREPDNAMYRRNLDRLETLMARRSGEPVPSKSATVDAALAFEGPPVPDAGHPARAPSVVTLAAPEAAADTPSATGAVASGDGSLATDTSSAEATSTARPGSSDASPTTDATPMANAAPTIDATTTADTTRDAVATLPVTSSPTLHDVLSPPRGSAIVGRSPEDARATGAWVATGDGPQGTLFDPTRQPAPVQARIVALAPNVYELQPSQWRQTVTLSLPQPLRPQYRGTAVATALPHAIGAVAIAPPKSAARVGAAPPTPQAAGSTGTQRRDELSVTPAAITRASFKSTADRSLRLLISNGMGRTGWAAENARLLRDHGALNVRIANYSHYQVERTAFSYRQGHRHDAERFLGRLNMPTAKLAESDQLPADIDVQVILGKDAAATAGPAT